jgi:hypothetical protein
MSDQAYVNLLREKVRQKEAEEKRIAAFGLAASIRFVPWIMPAQSQPQDASERKDAGGGSRRKKFQPRGRGERIHYRIIVTPAI